MIKNEEYWLLELSNNMDDYDNNRFDDIRITNPDKTVNEIIHELLQYHQKCMADRKFKIENEILVEDNDEFNIEYHKGAMYSIKEVLEDYTREELSKYDR